MASNAAATVINTATVGGGGETNVANDTATDSTRSPVFRSDDHVESHRQLCARVVRRDLYPLTVTNVGGGPTVGTVTVVDTLSAGLTATSISGTGWACVPATRTCTRSDVLAGGGGYPGITITGGGAEGTGGRRQVRAGVGGGGEPNNQTNPATPPRGGGRRARAEAGGGGCRWLRVGLVGGAAGAPGAGRGCEGTGQGGGRRAGFFSARFIGARARPGLQDAELAFGLTPLLDRANLTVQPGERIGLIGRNGTGKSSLLNVIAGRAELAR